MKEWWECAAERGRNIARSAAAAEEEEREEERAPMSKSKTNAKMPEEEIGNNDHFADIANVHGQEYDAGRNRNRDLARFSKYKLN